MHSLAFLSLRVPVTPCGTMDPESLCPESLDRWGLSGGQEAITSPLAVPSHPPCLGFCVTYASTFLSPPVFPLSWARGGWVQRGDTQWDLPPVPMAGLRAAPMVRPSSHGCLAAP